MEDENGTGVTETDDELEEAVVAYVADFADRISTKMLEAPDPATAVQTFVRELRADGGLSQLLGSAFDDGRRDAMLAAARFAEGDGPSVTWEPYEGGERLVLWRESHICLACVHGSVCVVQRSIPEDMLVQVRRCLAFEDREG